jgi:hypothetical protein
MGNFYTNITLRTTDRQAVTENMRAQNRSCFISPTLRGFTTIYDRRCEDQDVRELENLTADLSSQFHCGALAVLNHDDDVLWIGLARNGEWVTTYRSDQGTSGSAWKLAREFGVLGLLPLIWLLMRWPVVLFEIWRHGGLAAVLGIPNFTVGFGYNYLLRGERPSSETTDEFQSI